MWQTKTDENREALYGKNGFLTGIPGFVGTGGTMSAQLKELLGLTGTGSPATVFAEAVSSAFFSNKLVANDRVKEKEQQTGDTLRDVESKYNKWAIASSWAKTNEEKAEANQLLTEYQQEYNKAQAAGYINANSYDGWTKSGYVAGSYRRGAFGSEISKDAATGGDKYKFDLTKKVQSYEEWANTVNGGAELNSWMLAPYSEIKKEISNRSKGDGTRVFLENILRAREELPKKYNLKRDPYNSYFDDLFYSIDDTTLFEALRTNNYSNLTEYQKVIAGIAKAFQQDQNATTKGVVTYDDNFGTRVMISQRVGTGANPVYFYGSGTLGVEESSDAIINELGTEAIITPSGTLTALPAKTGIVPADITKNVWQLGEVAPTILRYLDQIISRDELSAGKFAQNVDESFNISNLVMNVNADSSFDPDEFVRQIKSRVALTKNL